jgi:hypothetical protein
MREVGDGRHQLQDVQDMGKCLSVTASGIGSQMSGTGIVTVMFLKQRVALKVPNIEECRVLGCDAVWVFIIN